MADYWKNVDTIVMGRKTWDIAAQQKGGGGSAGGMHSYVFSGTLNKIARKGVTLVKDDPGEFVRALKERDGKDICVLGGSNFARSLFAAGVIDEVGFNMHPVLLGSGVPLFLDAGRIPLELTECRQIDGGCVYTTYRVLAATARKA
jgi:dihydrofolate reductase